MAINKNRRAAFKLALELALSSIGYVPTDGQLSGIVDAMEAVASGSSWPGPAPIPAAPPILGPKPTLTGPAAAPLSPSLAARIAQANAMQASKVKAPTRVPVGSKGPGGHGGQTGAEDSKAVQ